MQFRLEIQVLETSDIITESDGKVEVELEDIWE